MHVFFRTGSFSLPIYVFSPCSYSNICSHQICSTFSSLTKNILIHIIMSAFPNKVIFKIPNTIAWRWRMMTSSREEFWYSSMLGWIPSTQAAAFPSHLVSPFEIIIFYIIPTHLSQILSFSQNCPKYSRPVRTILFHILPVYLFIVQHFCFFHIPFRPQCFELLSSHIAIFQHLSGTLQSLLQFWLPPPSREEQWDAASWIGIIAQTGKEIKKSELSSSWWQYANKPPRNMRCTQKRGWKLLNWNIQNY